MSHELEAPSTPSETPTETPVDPTLGRQALALVRSKSQCVQKIAEDACRYLEWVGVEPVYVVVIGRVQRPDLPPGQFTYLQQYLSNAHVPLGVFDGVLAKTAAYRDMHAEGQQMAVNPADFIEVGSNLALARMPAGRIHQ